MPNSHDIQTNISLPKDNNRVTVIGGTSSTDGVTPTTIWVDPSTHRVLVNSSAGLQSGTTTISNGAKGGILIDNPAGTVAELPIGTNGQILSVSAGGLPSWITNTATGIPTQFDYIIEKSGANTVAISGVDGSTFSTNTNSTTTIQAVLNALTTGGNILIKDATYTITATLLIKSANTRIFGQGSNTILSFAGGSFTPCIKANSTSYNNCQMQSFVINNTNATTGVAILVNDSAFGIYRDLQINGGATGIQMIDSVNTTFYNSFFDIEIGLSVNTITCIDMCPSGNPVNNNSFYRMRTAPGTNGYGLRMRGGCNGNIFHGFTCETASLSGQKGISMEGTGGGTVIYGNSFYGLYIEQAAVGINLNANTQTNLFSGGVVDINTNNVVDAGFANSYLNIQSTGSAIINQIGMPTTVYDNTPGGGTFTIKNDTNFANVVANFISAQLVNGTDSANLLQLKNAGTGKTLSFNDGTVERGYITKNGGIPPRILSAASYTTNTGTSINSDIQDMFIVTAQAGALKFNNPTGTPTDGQKLIISVASSTTAARALTWDTAYGATTALLPTTTATTTATLTIGFIWSASKSLWQCVAVA